jgi:hypothetical protein
MVNQKLTFGPYSISGFKKEWPGIEIPFITKMSKAKEKFHFNQTFQDSIVGSVFCTNLYNNKELDITLFTYFNLNIPTKFQYTFSGTIVSPSMKHVEFIIYNPENSTPWKGITHGVIKVPESTDHIYEMVGVQKLEGEKYPDMVRNIGFEILKDRQTIAAVSFLTGKKSDGKVWILNDLDTNEKIVVASIFSSIFLKKPLEEEYKRTHPQ